MSKVSGEGANRPAPRSDLHELMEARPPTGPENDAVAPSKKSSHLPVVVVLLSLWVILTVVPALVVQVVFHPDLNTTNLGGPFWLWIGGYLAALFVFMAAQRLSGHRLFAMYFVVSLLPFVADGAAVVSLLWLIPVAVFAALCAAFVIVLVSREDSFEKRAVRANGTVLEVMRPALGMNVITNDAYINRTLRIRVERPDGVAPYEAKVAGTFMFGDIPGPGDSVALLVDPRKADHIEFVTDGTPADPNAAGQGAGTGLGGGPDTASPYPTVTAESARAHARQAAEQLAALSAQMAAARGAGVATADATANAGGGAATDTGDPGASVAASLAELDRLHTSGALSDAEFASAKGKLLG
jgi:hypothetical protein